MARFYPTIDDDFHGSDGEIQVYQALQQLSDGYVVFHSFRWLGEPGQYRSEGEGDMLIDTDTVRTCCFISCSVDIESAIAIDTSLSAIKDDDIVSGLGSRQGVCSGNIVL